MQPAPRIPQPIPYVQNASLFVGDLDQNTTEAMLFQTFSQIGPVLSVRIPRDPVTQLSLRYGYVNFGDPKDADRALNVLNFHSINGTPCRIMWVNRNPELRKSNLGNLIVKNLHPSIDSKIFYDRLSIFGTILSCKVQTAEDGTSRGFGFVHFTNPGDAEECLNKLNGTLFGPTFPDKLVLCERFDKTRSTKWTNCYIKQFPASWTEERIREIFGAFGTITSLKLAVDDKGESKRFAFVNFAEHDDAVRARNELHEKEVEPEVRLYVARCQSWKERQKERHEKFQQVKRAKAEQNRGCNLYVKYLPDDIDDKALREMFEPHGKITSACVRKLEDGRSHGDGFVCFETPEAATNAIQHLNGNPIGSKRLYVQLHQKKEERTRDMQARRNMQRMTMGYPGRAPGMPISNVYPQSYNQHHQQLHGQALQPPGNYFAYRMPYNHPSHHQHAGQQVVYPYPPQPQPGQHVRPAHNAGHVDRSQAYNPSQRKPGRPARKQTGNRPLVVESVQYDSAPSMTAIPPAVSAVKPLPNPGYISAAPAQSHGIDPAYLATLSHEEQQLYLGEKLYPLIERLNGTHYAPKVTGMILELDTSEILHLLETPAALHEKADEAMQVLQEYENKASHEGN